MTLNSEKIYECAFDDQAFDEIATQIVKSFNARSMILHMKSNDGKYEIATNNGFWSSQQLKSYSDYYNKKDILWEIRNRPQNRNKTYNIFSDLISKSHFEKSEIYIDHHRKYGDDLCHAIGGVHETKHGLVAIGVHRGKNSKPFEDIEVKRLEILSNSLIKMIVTRNEISKLKTQNQLYSNVLGNYNTPFVHLSASLEIINSNNSGLEQILKANNLYISGKHIIGKCTFSRSLLKKFDSAITRNSKYPANAIESKIIINAPSGQRLLVEKIFEAQGQNSLSQNSGDYLITICTQERNDFQLVECLQEKYNLTNSEAKVALQIYNCKSIDEIASERNVSRNTIKSQLNQIYLKTNCDKQVKLVRIINECRF
jgi:DNA-binding NarL/FixJ family response regulator